MEKFNLHISDGSLLATGLREGKEKKNTEMRIWDGTIQFSYVPVILFSLYCTVGSLLYF